MAFFRFSFISHQLEPINSQEKNAHVLMSLGLNHADTQDSWLFLLELTIQKMMWTSFCSHEKCCNNTKGYFTFIQ